MFQTDLKKMTQGYSTLIGDTVIAEIQTRNDWRIQQG